ncbi:MAG: TetR/AcrR family transcriptional regulator [Myxococcales bacterium]|nr:MAG: TetR/AcrR family transcriptional regulator [Myxococcales bacterium]
MRRNSDDRPPNARQRIIEEATRQFSEVGFKGATLQSIADAVGMQKPSLVYHFRSKEGLHRAVLENLMLHWQNKVPRLMEAAASGHDRFASTLNMVLDFFKADRNRARFAMRESLDNLDMVHALAKQHLRPWITVLVDYIKIGQRMGIIKPEVDPRSYIILIMMMTLGAVAFGSVSRPLFDVDEEKSLEPQLKELLRIAKEALFVERAKPPSDGAAKGAPAAESSRQKS